MSLFERVKDFFSCQIEAGTIAIKNSKNTFKILDEWIKTTSEIAEFNSILPDTRSRHDQEALTTLSINNKSINVESWFQNKFSKSNIRNYIQYESNIT